MTPPTTYCPPSIPHSSGYPSMHPSSFFAAAAAAAAVAAVGNNTASIPHGISPSSASPYHGPTNGE